MKYLAVLLLGALLGALIHREVANWRAGERDVATCSPSPGASPSNATSAGDAANANPSRDPPPSSAPSAATAPAPSPPPLTAQAPEAEELLIPVQGKRAADLTDTFTDARSQGRSHDAIDIMAPAGTPVLAVADGHVEKLFDSARGGLTLYQFEPSGRYAYYYAHLQRYADGLAEKQPLKRGQVVGYVGSSGNASPDAPHLHFAIFVLGPERHWWEGQAINPYPILTRH